MDESQEMTGPSLAESVAQLDDSQLLKQLREMDRIGLALLSAPSEGEDLQVRSWRTAAGAFGVLSLYTAQAAQLRKIDDVMARFVARHYLLIRTPGFGRYKRPAWWLDESLRALVAEGVEIPLEEISDPQQTSSNGPWSTSQATWWRDLGEEIFVDAATGRPQQQALRNSVHRRHCFAGGELDGSEYSIEQLVDTGKKSIDPAVLDTYELIGLASSDELFAVPTCTWRSRELA